MSGQNTTDTNGFFVVFDGTDGSGKATQVQLFLERLHSLGHKANKIDFPQYKKNFFGKFLWNALKEGKYGDYLGVNPYTASIAYACDRFQSSGTIRSWLEEGSIVVSDRYVSANQIHQGGKFSDPAEREEFLLWLDQMEFDEFKIPRPEVIVYLHVPLEISLELIRQRAIENGELPDQAESDATHLFESQKAALSIVESRNNWIKIDCAHSTFVGPKMRSREDIAEEVFTKVIKFIEAKQM